METKDIEKKLTYYLDVLNDIGVKLEIDFKNKRVSELEKITSDSSFWNDMESAKNILGELKGLKDICTKYNNLYSSINTLIEMFELELSEEDLNSIIVEVSKIDEELEKLKLFVLLSGEFDSNNAYVEIHSGAGGTESNDWANMLLRMYTRYFDKNDYKYEIISRQDGEEVGIKGCTLLVKGYYAYGYLKGETGVHRLVRISPFDSNSRRHTSFASVLVTPEINKKLEVEIKDSDLRIDVYRSSGCGGQGVNTTDSAVRITHLPTNTVVTCQNERSQIQNKEQAMKVLKSRLYEMEKQKRDSELANERKSQVGSGDRSEKIRTYNYPQGRITDHRIGLSIYQMEDFLNGNLDEMIDNLIAADRAEKLKGSEE